MLVYLFMPHIVIFLHLFLYCALALKSLFILLELNILLVLSTIATHVAIGMVRTEIQVQNWTMPVKTKNKTFYKNDNDFLQECALALKSLFILLERNILLVLSTIATHVAIGMVRTEIQVQNWTMPVKTKNKTFYKNDKKRLTA